MKRKKTYEQPIEEIVFFQSADVVTTSGATTTGQGVDPYLYDPYGDQWEETEV